jgi:hypothetical protein
VACSWSGDLADFLSTCSLQLYSARLRREAMPSWRGSPDVRLDASALDPVSTSLFGLASISIHHKSSDMQAAALASIVRLTYVLPDRCLELVVQGLHESLASHDAVHQIDQSIHLLAGASTPLPIL